jgi:hypothetical protein
MPLTGKGEKIMGSMKEQYGPEKGEEVFYASKNKGNIKGVDKSDADEPPGQEKQQQQQHPLPEQLARAEQELEQLEREQEQAEEGQERKNQIADRKKAIRGLRDEVKNQARQALTRMGEQTGEQTGERQDALEALEAKQDAEEREKMIMDMVADACRRLDALEARTNCDDGDFGKAAHQKALQEMMGDDGGPGSGPRPSVGAGMQPSATQQRPSGGSNYNREAVNKAIASSNRAGRKIGGREASAIHRLLAGRH